MEARNEAARRALVSWSGGKDSCLALHEVLRSGEFSVDALLTTVTRDYDRISMHGVRRVLLQRQAASLGIALEEVFISKGAENAEYEARMGETLDLARERGVEAVIFGDLFLADIRAWREKLLARHGLAGIYPLWGRDTRAVMQDFLSRGFKTATVCVDPAKLDPAFVGRIIDEAFLAELPASVDPCGENGEFHSFVFDGPIFREPVRFSFGDIVCRDSFWFCDLVPDE
ncbi:MAG TPA: diphthine--ammonia ligase [Rhizomicrobium sp.]|jgi:uncharacterized protein (TIGR00290 family)